MVIIVAENVWRIQWISFFLRKTWLILLLLLLLYSFHPIAEITLKNANIKDEL